jgi:hypothetical protein
MRRPRVPDVLRAPRMLSRTLVLTLSHTSYTKYISVCRKSYTYSFKAADRDSDLCHTVFIGVIGVEVERVRRMGG